eukprot:m51a1_g2765 hypothetical protein (1735) ;mRNA; f:992144-998673
MKGAKSAGSAGPAAPAAPPAPVQPAVPADPLAEVESWLLAGPSSSVQRACEYLLGALTMPHTHPPASLLVLCAERALALGLIPECSKVLAAAQAALAAPGASSGATGGQALCRAAIVRAQLETEALARSLMAQRNSGEDIADFRAIVERSLSSIAVLMQGLEAAFTPQSTRKSPRVGVLVNNVAVLWWRIARPLMSAEHWALLVPTLHTLARAVDESCEANFSFRCRLHMLLARCLESSDQPADALLAAQQAFNCAIKLREVPLSTAVAPSSQTGAASKDAAAAAAVAQASIAAGSPTASTASATLRAEALRLYVHASRGSPEAVAKLRTDIFGGVQFKDLRPVFLAQCVLSGVSREQKAAQDTKEALGMTKGDDALVAEVAWAAVRAGLPAMARECLGRLALSRVPKARALSELANCELLLREVAEKREAVRPGSSRCVAGDDSSDAKAFHNVLSQLSSTFELCCRQQQQQLSGRQRDEHPKWGALIEQAAALSWRASLPMSREHHRTVKKVLQRAVASLTACGSVNALLFSRIHAELAHCEVRDDMLAQALVHAQRAIDLCPKAPFAGELVELVARLRLRMNIYGDTSICSLLERAYLAIERSRELRNMQKAAAGSRAASACVPQSDFAKELLSEAANALESAPQDLGRERATLLHSLCLESAALGLLAVLERGYHMWCSANWENATFTGAARLGADIHYAYARALLARKNVALVSNGVAIVWNTSLPLVRAAKWDAVREGLLECFKAIDESAHFAATDAECAGLVSVALLRSVLETQRVRGVAEPTLKSSLNAAEMKIAEDVTRFALNTNLPRSDKKEMVVLWNKVPQGAIRTVDSHGKPNQLQRIKGTPGALPKQCDERTQALIALENVCLEVTEGKKREALARSLAVLEASPTDSGDVDLFAKVAAEAIALRDFEVASRAAAKGLSLVDPARCSRDHLRWLAVCKYAQGQAAMGEAASVEQPVISVTNAHLLLQSAGIFADACQYSARSGELALLEHAIRLFWNVCLAVSKCTHMRKFIRAMLQSVVDSAVRASCTLHNVLLQMYNLLLECYESEENFEQGMTLIENAFKKLPKYLHGPLWRIKIQFLCGAGSDAISPAALGMTKESSLLQAQMYVTLAQSSAKTQDQQLWYDRSLKILSKHSLARAEVALECSAWMATVGKPVKMIRSLLRVHYDAELAAGLVREIDDVGHDLSFGSYLASNQAADKLLSAFDSVMNVWRILLGQSLPLRLTDWASVTSEYLLEQIPTGSVTQVNFPQGGAVLWQLRGMLYELATNGYHLHCLPIHHFIDVLASQVLSRECSPALVEAIRKRNELAKCLLLADMGMSTEYARARAAMESPLPSPEILSELKGEKREREALLQLADSVESNPSTARSSRRPMTRQAFYSRNLIAALALGRHSRESRLSSTVYVIPLEAAHSATTEEEWAETARLLIREGQYTPAKWLLGEALALASDQGNRRVFSVVFHLLAVIADYEHFTDHALELEREAQVEGGTPEFWRDSASHVSELAVRGLADAGGDPLLGAREAENALAEAENSLCGAPPGALRRIQRCRAELQVFIAERQQTMQLAQRAARHFVEAASDDGKRVDVIELAESAMCSMKTCAGAPLLLSTALRYSRLLRQQASTSPQEAFVESLHRAHDALVQACDTATATLASAAPQGVASASGELCIPMAKLLAAAHVEMGDVECELWRLGGGMKRQESQLDPVQRYLEQAERPTVPTGLL